MLYTVMYTLYILCELGISGEPQFYTQDQSQDTL